MDVCVCMYVCMYVKMDGWMLQSGYKGSKRQDVSKRPKKPKPRSQADDADHMSTQCTVILILKIVHNCL